MELIAIALMVILSAGLGLLAARATLAAVFALMMRPAPLAETAAVPGRNRNRVS